MIPISQLARLARQVNVCSVKCAATQLVRHQSTAPKELVQVDVNGTTGFATVTMNRAPVNSLNLDLLSAISKTLDDLQNNKSRGMILTSVR